MNTIATLREDLNEMSSVMYKKHNSYAYPAGYMESMIRQMIEGMPKKQQAYWIEQIQDATKQAKASLNN
jgi:peroxiredoxin family protein